MNGFWKITGYTRKFHLLVSFFVSIVIGLCIWRFSLSHPLDYFNKDELWYVNFFAQYKATNFLVFCYMIYMFLVLLDYIRQKPTLRSLIIHGVICIIIVVSLCTIPAMYPIPVVFTQLSYHICCCGLLICLFLIELGCFLYRLYNQNKSSQHNVCENTKWDDFAHAIIDFLDKKDIPNESFAIGISSVWGSGKTTFLNHLREVLMSKTENYCVYEFKPWQMTSPEQINNEFFRLFKSILRNEFSWYSDELLDAITKYVNLLLLNTHSISNEIKSSIAIFLGYQETTIEGLREKIDEGLVGCKKKIVILIDDVDRLEYNELFELLRLIRISANFRNVIFVVAYDKTYIAQLLEDHQIPNGEEYLKKIINLEITLPAYEYNLLIRMLHRRLLEIVAIDEKAQKAIKMAMSYRYDNSYLCSKYFTNFRDVERFSNYFATILTYLEQQEKINLNLTDLFWLEVLHYFEYHVYAQLKQDCWYYLRINGTNKEWMEYKEDDEKNIILKCLFPRDIKHRLDKIAWRNNFRSYFAYRQLNDTLSLQEFCDLIESKLNRDDFITQLKKLINKSKNPLEPFVDLLCTYNNISFPTTQAEKNYLHVLLYLAYNQGSQKYVMDTVITIFSQRFTSNVLNHPQVSSHELAAEMKYAIKNYGPSASWNKLLTKQIFPFIYDDVDEDEYSNGLLGLEEIRKMASLNWKLYIKNIKDIPHITTIFSNQNAISQFIGTMAYLESYSIIGSEESKNYTNLLPNALKSIYKGKYKEDDFIKMMNELVSTDFILETEEELDSIHKRICSLFGNLKSFNSFINNRFTLASATKKRYIKAYGLASD